MISWFLFITLFFQAKASASDCSHLFADPQQRSLASVTATSNSANEAAVNVIEYLKYLLENTKVLTLERLTEFRNNLIANNIVNPIAELSTHFRLENHVHFTQLQAYLKDTEINWIQVAQWINEYLNSHDDQQQQREETEVAARPTFRPLEFALIPHGSYTQNFMMERRFLFWKTKVPVMAHLTNGFVVSTTPITQAQWVEVMGHNPSHHIEGPFTTTMVVNGNRIPLQPDNPVENITWWSILVYLNRLSELHGLKPAYDLDHISFFSHISGMKDKFVEAKTFYYHDDPDLAFQKAAKGVLTAVETGDSPLVPRINSIDGSIYNADGYRLLTTYEYEYLLSDMGKHEGKLYFELNSFKALEHAWLAENSNGETQPVAMLLGLPVGNSKCLYDLIGNVESYCQNRMILLTNNQVDPEGVTDFYPITKYHIGMVTNDLLVSAMGCAYTASLRAGGFSRSFETSRSLGRLGFRVARTVAPRKRDAFK